MRWVVVAALVVSCGVGLADELPEDTNEIKTLTVEQARDLVRLHPYQLDLDGLRNLSPDVAAILISTNYPNANAILSLNGLRELSPETARALATYSGELRLRGLCALDADTLTALIPASDGSSNDCDFDLSERPEKELKLDGLRRIDRETAVALANYRGGTLSLGGLSSLTPEIAEALSAYRGDLYLSGIRSLDETTAVALLGNATLHLNGLTELPVETPTALAGSYRDLYLDGLESISPEAAVALWNTRRQFISFGNLKEVSDELVETFVRLLGDKGGRSISLRGLDVLTNTSLAKILCSNERKYVMGDLPTFEAGQGHFGNLKTLGPEVAKVLSATDLPILDLRGLQKLLPDTAATLGTFDGYRKPYLVYSSEEDDWEIGGVDLYCTLLLDGLSVIPEESLESFCDSARKRATNRHESERWMPCFTHLSLNGIRQLPAKSASLLSEIDVTNLRLNGLRDISQEAAKAFAEGKASTIYLDGLTTLSNEAAEALVKFKGDLHLNGLKVIDKKLAKVFANIECKRIYLGGITSLPIDVERVLASSLNAITERDRKSPWQWEHWIRLENLKEIKTADLAKAFSLASETNNKKYLGEGVGTRLDVYAEKLSIEAAKAFAEEQWPDEISLLALQSLAPDIAKIFVASHKPLIISCDDVSPAVAEVLATHENSIYIAPDHNLSLEAAYGLQPHKYLLEIVVAADYNPETLGVLSKHEGKLDVYGLREIKSVQLARKLVDSVGGEIYLDLQQLEKLSPEVAEILIELKNGLYMPSLTTLSPEAAEVLAKYDGYLALDGLTSLTSRPLAKKLASQEGDSLDFYELRTLSPDAADALAEFNGELILSRLRSLSSKLLAEKLASEDWDGVNVGCLTKISPEVAETLAKHEGELYLDSKALTTEVAEALAKHKGDLTLSGVTTITPEVARALAKHEGDLNLYGLTTLDSVPLARKWLKDEAYIDGLTSITPEVAEALAKHEGDLALSGVTTITPEALKILRANPAIDVPSEFDE